MNIFIFILIVASGVQINGYAVVDVLLLACFLFVIYINKKKVKIKINSVLIFCIYMLVQTFRGFFVLNDIRMIYWVIFFIVVYFSHKYLSEFHSKWKLDFHFIEFVFRCSLLYCIIYGIFPLVFRDADDFQGIYWVGSSSAFIVVIPLVCSHFALAQNSKYQLSKLRMPSLMIYLAVTVIHYSRIGMYLLFFYIPYLSFKASIFKVRKFFIMLLIIICVYIVWDLTRKLYYPSPGAAGTTELNQIVGVNDGGVKSLQKTSNDFARFVMVLSVYDKFLSSPKEFLFGSGWYTSRYTLKPYEKHNVKKFGLSGAHVHPNKPMQVTGFAAIVSDTGLVGFLFIIYFFIKSSLQIFKTKFCGRMLYIFYLLLLWLFFLVGNPFVSIMTYLLFLPNGLLFCLAQIASPKRS